MPVDRSDVVEAQLVEERAAGEQAARIFFHLARRAVQRLRHRPRQLLRQFARPEILVRAHQPGERVAQRPNGRRDRHVIVVEDDHQPISGGGGIIHRLIGHAGTHRAVADDGNRLTRRIGQLVGNREPEGGRDGRRTVRCAERVVFALAALGKAAEAPALPERADAVTAAGDDLVRIGLVANVPDQAIARCLEDVVKRNGELDHAKTRTEVAPGHGYGGDRLLPELVGELRKLVTLQLPNVIGIVDRIEQWCVWPVGHGLALIRNPRPCHPRGRPLSKCSRNAQEGRRSPFCFTRASMALTADLKRASQLPLISMKLVRDRTRVALAMRSNFSRSSGVL